MKTIFKDFRLHDRIFIERGQCKSLGKKENWNEEPIVQAKNIPLLQNERTKREPKQFSNSVYKDSDQSLTFLYDISLPFGSSCYDNIAGLKQINFYIFFDCLICLEISQDHCVKLCEADGMEIVMRAHLYSLFAKIKRRKKIS